MDVPISYYPGAIECDFEEVLKSVEEFLYQTTFKLLGKTVNMNYKSAAFRLREGEVGGYYSETMKILDDSPQLLLDIWKKVEEMSSQEYFYVRVIHYRDARDYIGYHRDREALVGSIASVSIGATRRFLVRSEEDKKNITTYTLKHGDLLIMHEGCQNSYKHCVPRMSVKDLVAHMESKNVTIPKGRKTLEGLYKLAEENEITPMRISLTFRR